MESTPKEIYHQIFNTAGEDPNIIGFFLGGSRGKEREMIYSDYDIYIITKDKVLNEYKLRYPMNKYKGIDLILYSLSEFKKYAYWNGPEQWDRYNFTRIKVKIDKNNEIQNLVDEKGKIPVDNLKNFIEEELDSYINYVYRSLKCLRDQDIDAARLEASISIHNFLNLIFAIHNNRLCPYYKYLKWELANFALNKIPLKSSEIITSIEKILCNADSHTQYSLFLMIEILLRKEGYGDIFDKWGVNLTWIKNYKH
ncbi:MAG: hypothetical protein KGD57_08265 [Candidatus Lokiarchaeota archaeon]|nr:hypothetical protein [Candidatus Lokiarchaeota archaeon]